ncbi:hypothetical protein ABW20_dc0110533 [Dactylellina cionopaga]|nr:hypothetical protein ABW20_dc0110533 [Dactylellina cionopaga]
MSKRKRIDENDGQRARVRKVSQDEFTIGWVCAIPLEMAAAKVMLDTVFPDLPNQSNDRNAYTCGSIGVHNVVISCLPLGVYGTTSAAVVASQMRVSFPSIRFYFMVGIGGGVPSDTADIRLGDIVVSKPTGQSPGIIQYDYGKAVAGSFQRMGVLNKPPFELLTAVSKLQANQITEGSRISDFLSEAIKRYPRTTTQYAHPGQDQLFQATYNHTSGNNCDHCDLTQLVLRPIRTTNGPAVHYGLIASGNQVMKDGILRDQIARELDIYCFEMEAAGLMDTLPCLVVRGICDYSDSHKNKHWQEYAAATAAAYTKELLYTLPASQRPWTDSQDGHRENCLKSLSFQNIDARFHDIAVAHAGTCSWLFETPQFQKWKNRQDVQDYNGVLWIKGKPGAGKSTLMKHTLLYCKDSFSDHHIATYFFNARGRALEKCTIGMLRSLLYQLLEKDPQSCDRFMPLFLDKRKKHGRSWKWHPGELKGFLQELIRYCSHPILLLVDALDECDEPEVRAVVSFLESLASISIISGTSLKICLSSRHYPTISMAKMLDLVIENQYQHNQDISIYVHHKLRTKDDDIEKEIMRKADGIFLWVILVTEILNQAFEEGRIALVRERISQIPGDLDEVFSILLGKDNQNRHETVLIFQWVLLARYPLSPAQLYYAVLAGTNPSSLGRCDRSVITDKTIERYITSTSRGLIEIRWLKNSVNEARFIHQTVSDFLLRNRRLQRLDPTLVPHVVEASHGRLATCCLSYINMEELRLLSLRSFTDQNEVSQAYPFLQYATLNIFKHAETASIGDIRQDTLLARLHHDPNLLQQLQTFHNTFVSNESLKYSIGTNLLYTLAIDHKLGLVKTLLLDNSVNVNAQGGYYGNSLQAVIAVWGFGFASPEPLNKFVQVLLNAGADVNTSGGRYGSALQAAIASFSELNGLSANIEVIEMLLDAGANVNAQGGPYGNALNAALRTYCGQPKDEIQKLVHILLDAGANVNAQGGMSGDENALYALVKTDRSKPNYDTIGQILGMLLAAGADVNAQGGYYGNVLQAALAQLSRSTGTPESKVALVKMLLDAGADVNAKGGHYGTCLQATIGYGITTMTVDVIKMLLDAGADVNAPGGNYGACLAAAISYGITTTTVDVVKMLLDAGAHLNAQNSGYGNVVKAVMARLYLGEIENGLKILGMLHNAGAIGAVEVKQAVYDVYGRKTAKIESFEASN